MLAPSPNREADVLRRFSLAPIGLLLLLVPACGGGGSSSASDPEQRAAEGIDMGSVQAVDLPSGFPDDLPLPDDAVAVHVAETSQGGPSVFFASGRTSDELQQFFSQALSEEGGWELSWHKNVQGSAGKYSLYSVVADEWTGSIFVGIGGPEASAYTGPYSFRVELTPV
jgi:hypothetical protein